MASFDAAEFIDAMTKMAKNEEFRRKFIDQVAASRLAIQVSSELEKIYDTLAAAANPHGDPLHPFPQPRPTPKPKKGSIVAMTVNPHGDPLHPFPQPHPKPKPKKSKTVATMANPHGDPLHILPKPKPTPKPKKGK